ncbi:TPA: hypothetical protein N3A08_004255 [Salmonella enterica subsp. salamae serovar 9,46:z4,z24:z39:z42]|nr:hypothetical protein [Salmonella enterica subsp. salamae serovar 9,46:z4,z24:z39:z42]
MIRIGNDGRIYSNEGFSNINWGIVGRQLELEKGKANFYAALDPRSSNDAHDEKATNTGYEMVEKAALDKKFPVKLDRKILFSLTLKALLTDGYRNMSLTAFQDNAASLLKQLAFSAGANGILPGVGNMTTFVQGSRTEHINLTDTNSVMGAKLINAGDMISISAGTLLSLVSGANSKEVCGGLKIIQAVDGIELHAGNASLTIKNDGQIDIKGARIAIDNSENILIKSPLVNIEAK